MPSTIMCHETARVFVSEDSDDKDQTKVSGIFHPIYLCISGENVHPGYLEKDRPGNIIYVFLVINHYRFG